MAGSHFLCTVSHTAEEEGVGGEGGGGSLLSRLRSPCSLRERERARARARARAREKEKEREREAQKEPRKGWVEQGDKVG